MGVTEGKQKIVGRSERLAFMKTEGTTFARMTGFTSLGNSKNPKEYTRQYVDESSERSDVVGYAESKDYEFDRHTNNLVHEKLANIADEEIVGTDAQVEILSVDLFGTNATDTTAPAKLRTYSVIPDSDGGSNDALTYSGKLSAASEIVKGTATTTDGWKTCTFAEASA